MATLKSNIPSGPLAEKWEHHKFSSKLINPANKRKYKVIVVGAGLAGASTSASPAPTTMTLYFRLLAGLINLELNL